MRINARLDDDHARKLEFLHVRTGARTSDIIKDAIDLYYREMKRPASDAARVLRAADFIGCGEAESDLSVRYKDVYSEILEHKHGNR
jgi:predicted DNA-binding protein